MFRMRNTITALVLCLLTLLSGVGLLAAAEPQVDEKITMPKAPPTPEQRGTVPHPSGTTPSVQTPPPAIPVVPVPPDKAVPVEIPVIPVLPDTTSPAAIPVLPVPPQAPGKTTAPAMPPHQQETKPQKEAVAPHSASPKPEVPAALEPGKQPSPMDFLLMPTPLVPDKTQVDQTKPAPGSPLLIPPDAAKTGDLSFLEGCWRGTRPEYKTKRTITERFCFDKNGKGKRFIDDPQHAGKCAGASKGSFDARGRLIVTSERASCTDAKGRSRRWGQAYMVCQGEGDSTPCFWRFPDAGGGTQTYKIPLVRE